MMISILLFILTSGLIHQVVVTSTAETEPFEGIVTGCDSIPDLNQRVIDFVKPNLKKRVGRGECWDLANEALISIGAKWDGRYEFGRLVNHKEECVFPGDLVQFERVKASFKEGSRTEVWEFPHHTAVIYEVKGPGRYVLAHQNTSFSGKKVGLSELDLAHVVRGRYKIYRPVKG